MIRSIPEWLVEQEHKRSRLVFVLEWLFIFAFALLFWIIIFYKIHASQLSMAAALAVASFYASGVVYLRLIRETGCQKCKSLLPLSREVVSRRHVRDEERCFEIVRGGEEWDGHFIDLYSRNYRVDIVRVRCRRCRAKWDEVEVFPTSDYKLVRTIDVKD